MTPRLRGGGDSVGREGRVARGGPRRLPEAGARLGQGPRLLRGRARCWELQKAWG